MWSRELGPMDVSECQLHARTCHGLLRCDFTTLLLGRKLFLLQNSSRVQGKGTTPGNQLCLSGASMLCGLLGYTHGPRTLTSILFLMHTHLHHLLPLDPKIDGYLLNGTE